MCCCAVQAIAARDELAAAAVLASGGSSAALPSSSPSSSPLESIDRLGLRPKTGPHSLAKAKSEHSAQAERQEATPSSAVDRVQAGLRHWKEGHPTAYG